MKKHVTISVLLILLLTILGFVYKDRLLNKYRYIRRLTSGGSLLDLRVANARSKKVFFLSAGLKIVGDLYTSDINSPPCILLLHGSNVLGRRQPIILALAKKFQQLHYAVLAIDFRGFNESQDPPKIDTIQDLDLANDAISAIDYLVKNVDIDPSRLYIVAHSLGAGISLKVQQRDKRVKKLVAFGPPRRIYEKILDPKSNLRPFLLWRQLRHMELNITPATSIMEEAHRRRDISNYVKQFQTKNHIPLFLIDGEEEDEKDHVFLKSIYDLILPPKAYWTVPGVNHYLNTGFLLGLPCYSEITLNRFVSRINAWLLQDN